MGVSPQVSGSWTRWREVEGDVAREAAVARTAAGTGPGAPPGAAPAPPRAPAGREVERPGGRSGRPWRGAARVIHGTRPPGGFH